MKIIIGIDTGGSTTVVQTMEESERNAGNTECKPLCFTQGALPYTPTLVRLDEENGREWYGEAARETDCGKLYAGFDGMLSVKDREIQQTAVMVANKFLEYLRHCYEQERLKLYRNVQEAEEETVLKFPSWWDTDTRERLLAAARNAGFQNARGKDSATAAAICALTHHQEALREDGLLLEGKPLNIMVLEMEKSAMNQTFVQVSSKDGKFQTKILKAYPPESFGRRRIDDSLRYLLLKWLMDSGLDEELVDEIILNQPRSHEAWVDEVMTLLANNEKVTGCNYIKDNVTMLPGIKLQPFPAFDRAGFERITAKELSWFAEIIRRAPKELRQETQLVVLAGDNSQWYWIPEVLFRTAGFSLLNGHPERILSLPFPTEVMARGLIYSPEHIYFQGKKEKAKEEAEETKTTGQTKTTEKVKTTEKIKTTEKAKITEKAKTTEKVKTIEKNKTIEKPKKVEEPSSANIHENWRRKLAKGKYPDLQMMGRIFEDDNTTMAITDRGRLLMYPESKQPGPFESGVSLSREDELQEIICKNCFKTRGGKIVDRMGNILLENGEKIHRFQYVPELYQVDEQGRVRALFSHQNYYLANMFAGMEGSALLEEVNRRRENGNQTPVYISGWKVPLDRIAIFDLAIGTTAIGFTWQGSITFVSDEIRHKFLLKYPAFSDNGDGTVGSDILDMCVFCGYIITLHLGGSVHVWRLDEHKPIFEQGITAIGGSNGWFFALDENGMLHKFDMMFNIEKPQVKERFEDCVAFAFNPTRVPMVKSDGHVDFPHRGLFDGYRMLDVWNWRLKDS